MRPLVSAAVLASACAAAPAGPTTYPPDDGEPDTVVAPRCGSPLYDTIFDATRDVIWRGTVPERWYSTERNQADPAALIDGPQIFPAFRALIARAQHHVSLQTYVWEPGSDPANEILAGLADLARRRATEGSGAPPVTVRFLFDVSAIGFGSSISALPRAWASVEALALDPKHVRFELAGFHHLALGALHTKTLVVDGTHAIITGANPQGHHNYATPWRDAGFQVAGDVAIAMLAEFDDAWQQGRVWTCGAQEGGDPDACSADPTPLVFDLGDSDVPDTACQPMLVTSRQADPNPFSNRIDNTQDQAFLAAFGAATSHVRVQTPNLNDDAAKGALLAAATRGVRVEIVLAKGFNDITEQAPGQGGTNAANVRAMYQALAAAGVTDVCDKLHVRWYSRDGLRPIEGNGIYASHAKYASIDDQVAIVGTANMDTQSWNNSREVNIVVDDPAITRAWDAALFVRDFDRGIDVDECW
jgi:phosphatidylserine/phosphatidylglycerophosphate/cardiolipin synthase-like enzyme